MTCDDCRGATSAYMDAELAPGEMDAVRAHVAECAACAEQLAALGAQRALIRGSAPRYRAPDVLRARVRAIAAGSEPAQPPAPRRRTAWWRQTAAVAAFAFVAGGVVTAYVLRAPRAGTLAEALVASHVRSLPPGHLISVATSDQHTVKPWFNGRVGVSPPVPGLDSLGFPLIGGRVDTVGGRPAAVVVYGRRKHIISVFAWAAREADAPIATATQAGFHLVHLRQDGLEIWVVSDVGARELLEFTRLLLAPG